jgi:AcrR family transcriptional regulator
MTPQPRKKQRIRNPVQTRAKLLQATVDLVADKGHHALSLKEAARRANLSRGVAYQHFKDRDHLLREAKRWISNRLADGVRHIHDAPLEERVIYGAKLVLNNPEVAKLLIADALAGRDLRTNHPLFKLVLKTLKGFKASGVAREDIDPEVLTYIMLASNAAILMLGHTRKRGGADITAERFAKEWVGLLREGMYSKRARRRRFGQRRAPSKTNSQRR